MSKTVTLPAGTMANTAIAQAFMDAHANDLPPAETPVTELPPVVVQPEAVTKVADFTDFIGLLDTTPQARRYVLWATANSLNNFVIANCQAHIRAETYKANEVNQDIEYLTALGMDQRTIDLFNEQKALLDEIRANAANTVEQGFEVQAMPYETAERLVNLRGYIADVMKSTAKTARDLAQPIAESIAYRLSKMPAVDESKVLRWLVACEGKIPVEELRRVSMKQQLTDRQQLVEQMGRIIDLSKEMAWKGTVSDDEVEALFDELPVHVRYRLIGGVVRSLNVAMANEVAAFIRFNRMESITNRVLIQSVLDGYIAYFGQFGSDNADALIAYEERGSKLPTVEELLADKSV